MLKIIIVAHVFISLGLAIKLPEIPETTKLKWWQEDIIYQIYPRSFFDSNGDGVGDIAGIKSQLDYFVDLGVGAIWLSPIYESPMVDFGYDISNFTNVEPLFGTMDDFRDLSHAMKERGIKLVMDFVPNHSSNLHEWFNKSEHRDGKYTDYYIWKDPKGFDEEGNPIFPNNWVSRFGGPAWTWSDIRQQFYFRQYTPEQPDLNYENREVILEMISIISCRPPDSIPFDHNYWLHIHTINQQPQCLLALAEFRKLLDVYDISDGRDRCMMTEAYLPLDDTMEYYGTEVSGPVAHFPFNFEFIQRVKKDFNGTDIAGVIDDWLTKMPEGQSANWLLGNHDRPRIGSRFSEKVIDAFNMLIMLLAGSVITYYGEEIGIINMNISWEDTVDPPGCNAGPERYHLLSRDPARTPMQWNSEKNAGFSTADKTWLPMNPNYPELNVEAQNTTSGDSHLKVYKRITELRKNDTWKYGSMESKALLEGSGFGYSRILKGHGFLYLANFDTETLVINANEEFEGIPATAIVHTTSINFKPETLVGSNIATNTVAIGSGHAIIIEF